MLNDGPLLVLAGVMTLDAICNETDGIVLDMLGRRKRYLIGLVSVWFVRSTYPTRSCALLRSPCTPRSHRHDGTRMAEYSGTANRVGQGPGIAMLFVFITFFAGCIDVSESGSQTVYSCQELAGRSQIITYMYCLEVFLTCHRAQGMSHSVAFFNILLLPVTAACALVPSPAE